jgi:Uma2 family endonuclease
LITALVTRLRGTSCLVHGSHLKIEVMGHIRYPDAFVVCTPLAKGTKRVHEPVVIFETLSESTAKTDLVDKNIEYCATSSVKRYVILDQDRISATVFSRRDEFWVEEPFGDGSTLHMPEIGISNPLAELYLDVNFGPKDMTK